MTGQSGGETGRGAGIGTRLRSARERSSLTVEQAAQRLHVAPAVLEALEAEDFASLGAPIYVKSYLARYAELVGESAEALQQLLSSAVVIPEPDLTRIPHATAGGNRLLGPAAVAVVALVVVGSLWWGFSRWHKRHLVSELPPRIVTREVVAHQAAAPAAVTARTEPRTAPVIAPAGGTVRASTAPAALSAGEVRIALKFSAPSWTEVDDATGRHLYRSLAPAAAMRVFQGRAPLHVLLGYAPGVTLAVDGRVTSISAFVRSDHAASFVIRADGRVLAGPRAGGE